LRTGNAGASRPARAGTHLFSVRPGGHIDRPGQVAVGNRSDRRGKGARWSAICCVAGLALVTPSLLAGPIVAEPQVAQPVVGRTPVARPFRPANTAQPYTARAIAASAGWQSTSQSPGYLALGDSYASGNGSGGTVTGGKCLRNDNAYPVLWQSLHPNYSLSFRACSGASITSVVRQQLQAMTAQTRLVSVTVGGDDNSYFNSLATGCIWENNLGLDSLCKSQVQEDEQSAMQVLGGPHGRYVYMFDAIDRKDQSFSAPGRPSSPAKLVVLDYPDPFSGSGRCGLWDNKSQRYLDDFANVLDHIMEESLLQAKLEMAAQFVDVRPAFSGHGICSATPWIYGLRLDSHGFKDSYHPNKLGQRAYAMLLSQAVGLSSAMGVPRRVGRAFAISSERIAR
jgi:GDSL-like Lipase/Acylhydrolase family